MKANDIELLTAQQVSDILHVSRRHVIAVLKKEIGYLRSGKEIMFDPKDVRAYINRIKVRAKISEPADVQ